MRTYFLLIPILLSLIAGPAEARPLALDFCYPVNPIGPAGDDQILCPLEGDIRTPETSAYYYNAQHFLQFNDTLQKYHLGDDWNGDGGGSTDYGDPVYAIADGVVVYVADSGEGQPDNWGKVVVVKHTLINGDEVYSLYGHLASWKVDELCHTSSSTLCVVEKGEEIAAIGDANGYYAASSPGCASETGCAHLHLEIRKTFALNNPDIIPGRGYAAEVDDPEIASNYYNPTAFIEAHRGPACLNPANLKSNAACSYKPAVSTNLATNITQGSASLSLSVDPNGAKTTVWFDWGTTSSLGQETSPRRDAGAGTTPIDVSITLGGLACGKTYYFRARAENAGGSAPPGQTLSFTTQACGSGGSPQSLQLVAEPSFENGSGNWWVASPAFYINRSPEFPNPRTGSYYAFLSRSSGTAGNNLEGGLISQPFTIPQKTSAAELRLWYRISTEETSTSANDKLEVYLVRSSNRLTLLTTLSNRDQTGTAYREKRLTVPTSLFGEQVQIFFRGTTNGTKPTLFRIDDVTLPVTTLSGGPPTVTSRAEDQVTAHSARLSMSVDPNGDDTEVWFDFEENDSTPNTDTEHIGIGSGSGSRVVSISVFGLSCGTMYYFRPNARNGYGFDDGAVRNFTTSACSSSQDDPPNANTDPARNITRTSAELVGQVDPNGLPTQAWFEWGTTSSLGQRTSSVSVGSGSSASEFTQTLSSLSCGTIYYFENHASSSAGEDDGVTYSFTTLSCNPSGSAPSVTTDEAGYEPSASGRAVLNATLNPNGVATRAWFQWGTTASYENSTVDFNMGSGTQDFPTSVTIEGLACGTTYHFRAVASNSFGTSYGADRQWTTTTCPLPTNVAPTFSFVEPDGLGDAADGSFLVTWSDSDPDSNAVITLSYSSSATCAAPTVIASAIPEDDPANSYTWNTAALSEGTYYLHASINDGIAPAVSRCSGSGVVVTHSSSSGPIVRVLTQGAPGQPGKDIWTTSVFSYQPVQGNPGGGLDDDRLRVGGWGDSYYSLIEFDLSGLPQQAQSAHIELFAKPNGSATTSLYLDRITTFWDWRTQGTGADRERLWWADRPNAVQWRSAPLPGPTAGTWYRIDITDLYNAWQAGTYPNHGIQLRPVSTSNTWAEFYSSDSSDPALRPRLVIDAEPPVAGHPTFRRISDLTTPRYSACAAKLTNGKVLIVGGTGTGHTNTLSSAELYDPATRTFAPTGSMTVPRDRPACVTLTDGRVLVAGGATARFEFTNSAEVYNPATGTFSAVGNMTSVRGEGWHMFAVPGGALLFGGTYEGSYGTATAEVDRFNTATGTFSRVGTLASARRDYTAQMLSDGTVLLVGGVARYDLPVTVPAELYGISSNQPISISQPNPAPYTRGWSSAVLPSGDVLVTSGKGAPSQIYKRASRSFEPVSGAPVFHAGDFGSAIPTADGRVLLLGYGRVSGQGGRIAEIFDPALGTFTALGSMVVPGECQGYTVTPLNDGTVLITGGGTDGDCGRGILVAEIFNPNGL